MWRSTKEEWERRKSYLIRSLFEDLPILSPINETQEPTSSSSSDIYRPESPLPDLIIEKEPPKQPQDESKEFYKRLEREMRRLYKRDFLNIEKDTSSSTTSPEIACEGERDSFDVDTSVEIEKSAQKEISEEEEYFPQSSRETFEEGKSIDSSTESTESEICRYEKITTAADVHIERISKPSLHDAEDGNGEEVCREKATEVTEISFSSDDIVRRHSDGEHAKNIELEVTRELAKSKEASPEESVPKSSDEYRQLTPEIMRRRQTMFSEDSLPHHELPICESTDKIMSQNATMDLENTSMTERVIASGFEMEIAESVLTDSNIVFTMTSTPKSSKTRPQSRFGRFKHRLVPYSPSSSESRQQRREMALQTSFPDDELDWRDIWSNFFVGIPTVYNICSCKNHVCS